jgi:plasmid replication initiation protein
VENRHSSEDILESLGITLRYVIKHNAISRAAHNLSATAQKLTAMAMALLPTDLSILTVAFTFMDFCKAVGGGDGGEQYRLFVMAVDECMKSVITIEIETKNGRKRWKKFSWFTAAEFSEETGVARLTFSAELAAVLSELKRLYAKIDLRDMGRLRSRYALRIFEMAKSYESLKGKNGNPDHEWYFERTIPELRLIFGVPDGLYAETKRFRQKVIEGPVKEINNAGVGFEVTTESIKQGRSLVALRLNCIQCPRKLVKCGKKRTEPLEAFEESFAKDSRMETTLSCAEIRAPHDA